MLEDVLQRRQTNTFPMFRRRLIRVSKGILRLVSWNPEKKFFSQSYEDPEIVDSAVLIMPLVFFCAAVRLLCSSEGTV